MRFIPVLLNLNFEKRRKKKCGWREMQANEIGAGVILPKKRSRKRIHSPLQSLHPPDVSEHTSHHPWPEWHIVQHIWRVRAVGIQFCSMSSICFSIFQSLCFPVTQRSFKSAYKREIIIKKCVFMYMHVILILCLLPWLWCQKHHMESWGVRLQAPPE